MAANGRALRSAPRFVASELRAGGDGGSGEGVTYWATFAGNGGPRFYLGHNPQPNNPQFAFSLLNATSRAVIDELIPRSPPSAGSGSPNWTSRSARCSAGRP